jgi:hypothetical protein
MKINHNILLIIITVISSIFCANVEAFSDKTHKAISENAVLNSQADVYLKNELGFSQGLGTMLLLDQSVVPVPERIPAAQFETRITPELPSNPCSILDFLKAGANLEDVPTPRARHHFHSPIANPGITPPNPNRGLDNKTDHPNVAWAADEYTQYKYHGLHFDLTGASAEKRALGTEEAVWKTEYQNYFAWPDTRTYFYRAFTKSNPAERNHYLALTFISLGQTAHLLEDMGVPAHTRNDFVSGHMKTTETSWGNQFEGWAEKRITTNNNNIPSSWLNGWTPQPKVFDKISKYWDTDLYTGTYIGLPSSVWGLAEQTNYQFLSTSTVFGCSGTKYQFPHPDVNNMSTPITESSGTGSKIYFNGANYGVSHIARESYTYHKVTYDYIGLGLPPQTIEKIDSTITTDDNAVFDDYANITIPRTINYTAGLANYFFRGRLDAELTDYNSINHKIEITITNKSINSDIEQTLKGGTFELYWDDKDSNRTPITTFVISDGWTPGSTLAYDAAKTITFTKPAGAEPVKYAIVYKGSICQNPAQPDSDDENAIAVCVLNLGFEIVAWGNDTYGQITGVPQGSNFIAVAAGAKHGLALTSDGKVRAWGSNIYGQCDVPSDNNNFIAIAAGGFHSMGIKSDGSIVVWGDNTGALHVCTNKPTGNDFVAIAAGYQHCLALKSDGSIVAWGGYNSHGEWSVPAPDPFTIYTEISAGWYHSIALQSDGVPKAWGDDEYGQTEFNDDILGIAAVAAGGIHTLILRDDKWLTSWGGGDWLGGVPRYHECPYDGNDFVKITAGYRHILALTNDGKIFSWNWPDGNYAFSYFLKNDVPTDIVFTESIAAGGTSGTADRDFSLALKSP